MGTKLLVVQPRVPTYRTAFWESLRERLAVEGIELLVAYGRPEPGYDKRGNSGHLSWGRECKTQFVHFAGRRVRRLDSRSVVSDFGPDLVVAEQSIHDLGVYPLMVQTRRMGAGFGMLGIGKNYATQQGRLLTSIKGRFTRMSDWFFVYTPGGADYLVAHGYPRTRISVLRNSTDTGGLRRDLAKVRPGDVEAFEALHGLKAGRTLLFMGGVDGPKDIRFLIAAAEWLGRLSPDARILVAGQGEMDAAVAVSASGGSPLVPIGPVSGLDKAIALCSSTAAVMPSAIGLVAVEALVAGLPVITRNNLTHGPEADYLENGHTSVWLGPDASSRQFAAAALDLLDDEPKLHQMQANCRVASADFSIEAMVESFTEGAIAWSEIHRAGL